MAPLMRPIAEASLHPELIQETLLEQEILAQLKGLREGFADISREVAGLRGQVRDMRSALMGEGEKGESPFGRLPMVERKVELHSGEIAQLKSDIQPLLASLASARSLERWGAGIIGSVIGGILMLVFGHLLFGK